MNKIALIILCISCFTFCKTSETVCELPEVAENVKDTIAVNHHNDLGTVLGVVKDEKGNALEFIKVVVNDDNYSFKATSDVNGKYKINLAPGQYTLKYVCLIGGYTQKTIDSVIVKKDEVTFLDVVLKEEEIRIELHKPIIYLYPEKETEVEVKVEPNGEFLFTYPVYNDSWKVTAFPNGKLKDSSNEYDYLFWDANIKWSPNKSYLENGSYVKKDELIPFFERKLKEIGFNLSEMNDFITFWGPKLSGNEMSYIYFVVNEDCDELSSLDIFPKPDNILRLFMIYHDASDLNKHNTIKEQEFKPFNRSGFSAVEWGGGEINLKIAQFEN